MGWTEKLPSGKFRGIYRTPDGRTRTAPGGPWTQNAAALRAANKAEADSRAPGWRDPEAGRRTWGEWCTAWWPTRQVEASTLATDTGRRDRHLTPRWADVPLCDITRQDIRAWAADLRDHGTAHDGKPGRPLAPATVQRIIHLLSASLLAAVDAGALTANPAARLNLGGASPIVERYLTREEYGKVRTELTKQADPAYPLLADLLVSTGLRWGEAVGLHRERLQPDRGVLEVIEVWTLTARTVKPYPKGKKRRVVPIPAWVDLPPSRDGDKCGHRHESGTCRSELVLVNSSGNVIDTSHFTKAWGKACKAAGVGHVRVHDLRHTYASWLIQAGVPLEEVGRLLGHISPVTTQRYAHLGATPSAAILAALSDPRATTKKNRQPRGLAGLRMV